MAPSQLAFFTGGRDTYQKTSPTLSCVSSSKSVTNRRSAASAFNLMKTKIFRTKWYENRISLKTGD